MYLITSFNPPISYSSTESAFLYIAIVSMWLSSDDVIQYGGQLSRFATKYYIFYPGNFILLGQHCFYLFDFVMKFQEIIMEYYSNDFKEDLDTLDNYIFHTF